MKNNVMANLQAFFTFSTGTTLPFSFNYGGRRLEHMLKDGSVRLEPSAEDGMEIVFPCGLSLRYAVQFSPSQNGMEYRLALTHHGDKPSGLISELMSADFSFAPTANAVKRSDDEGHFFDWDATPEFTLLTIGGAYSDPSDFTIRTHCMDRGSALSLVAGGGRSSSANLPYFRVTQGEHALITAIGWAGQWKASFEALTRRNLHVTLGLERTSLRLLPGESVLAPSIMLCYESGGDIDGLHNRFRAMMNAACPPEPQNDRLPVLFSNTCFVKKGEWLNETTAENQASLVHALAPLGVSAVITDAGWFDKGWPDGAGNWMHPKQEAYPDGFLPVSRAADAYGMRYGLWFEPERVMAGTRLADEIPQLCLRCPREEQAALGAHISPETMLADFGNPETREFFMDIVAHYIEQHGIRAYRQDFNMEPLAYWTAADEPDRTGAAELRYVTGLYAFWDGLRARFSDLFMDGCASGGRRLDFETLRRFHVHQKSDYWFDPLTDQNTLYALSLYLPNRCVTAHVDSLNAYDFFSAAAASLCLGWQADDPAFDLSAASGLIKQYNELRKLLTGDYYPLTDPAEGGQSGQYIGMEFCRSDIGCGVALLFRRTHTGVKTQAEEFTSPVFTLRGLKSIATEGSTFIKLSSYSTGEITTLPADLAQMLVMPEESNVEIVFYQCEI